MILSPGGKYTYQYIDNYKVFSLHFKTIWSQYYCLQNSNSAEQSMACFSFYIFFFQNVVILGMDQKSKKGNWQNIFKYCLVCCHGVLIFHRCWTWQGKLVASEPAAPFPNLAISIWLRWRRPAGCDRQDHWVAYGILNILLGLYHNQEQFLLLAPSVRIPPEIKAAQREGFLGVSLSHSEKLVEKIFGSR